MKPATDCLCSTGPCTEPIDLKSKDATLPDQSTLSSDAYAADAKLQKMINDKFASFDPSPDSMKNDNTFSFPGA